MRKLIFLLFISLNILTLSCTTSSKNFQTKEQKAKYVFLFIGDGMGLPQVYLTEAYLQQMNDSRDTQLEMMKFPVVGMASTYAENRFITGSAASGTALASGNKTSINTIGMDAAKSSPFQSIASKAKADGKKVGILSSVYINHATPAVFYAHQPERKMLHEIALDLANSDFDYYAGGGIASYKGDSGDKEDAIELAKKNGFTFSTTVEEFEAISANNSKVVAIAPDARNGKEMPYALDKKHAISLAEFTRKGIELLDNEEGFFMMVEGGKIDWACHANDAAASIQETIEFDKAIQEALAFYKKHPDETLIVITADHETGGLALGNALNRYESDLTLLQHQKVSIEGFEAIIADYKAKVNPREYDLADVMKIIEENFGLGNKELGLELSEYDYKLIKDAFYQSMGPDKLRKNKDELYIKYGISDPIVMTVIHMMAQKAGLAWTTYAHTAIPVPVFAIGVHADVFDTYIDNTDIPKEMMKAMHLK